ncbi:MAG: phospholipid carrier-dependent glycosyltransferase [Chloroflexota bacterium]
MKQLLFDRWAWLLFIAALIPRVLDLGQFITSDENTNIFLAGSAVVQAFLQGNLRETYWHFYPGVTMSWADGLGLTGQWLFETLTGTTTQPLQTYVEGDIRHLLVAVRLPYAILTALFVPVCYHLLKQWFGADLDTNLDTGLAKLLALTSALFIAFDPFFLAHSRVVHGDAPVSVFMVVSVLSLLLYLRAPSRTMLILSAISGSFAAMTKAPGQLMAVIVILVFGGDWLIQVIRSRQFDLKSGRQSFLAIVWWGLIALLALIVLWPAMWVDPIGTVRQMLDETFGKVNEGHLVFFQGQPTLDPGPWFYPWVIPFRLTPFTTGGVALSLAMLGYFAWAFRQQNKNQDEAQTSKHIYTLILFLWGFILFLILSGNLSPKKQDRYLLPVFPALDILAAIGWFGLWYGVSRMMKQRWWLPLGVSILIVAQIAVALPHHPYYLTYFNPMMGGLPRAVETTLVGWGEGMEQAAQYLNQKPNAENLFVASTPSQTLLPYFKGQGENFYTNDVAMRADYVVLYRAQQQRLAPSPDIVNHFLAQKPETVISLKGVPYAWIYPNNRLIFSDVPASAMLTNLGFGDIMRLAGYQLQRADTQLTVDLFWHALPPIEQALGPCQEIQVENIQTTVCPRLDYTMSVRLLDETGNIVAQQDSWPAEGLLPTSQWRVNDYIQDRHILTFPADNVDAFQMAVVVYDNQTQDVLAGPLTFATVTGP